MTPFLLMGSGSGQIQHIHVNHGVHVHSRSLLGGLYPKPQIPCGLQVDSRWIPGVQVDF